jgi:hypothetical protein
MISKSICGNTIISTSQSRTGDKKNSSAQRFWFFMRKRVQGSRFRVQGFKFFKGLDDETRVSGVSPATGCGSGQFNRK